MGLDWIPLTLVGIVALAAFLRTSALKAMLVDAKKQRDRIEAKCDGNLRWVDDRLDNLSQAVEGLMVEKPKVEPDRDFPVVGTFEDAEFGMAVNMDPLKAAHDAIRKTKAMLQIREPSKLERTDENEDHIRN